MPETWIPSQRHYETPTISEIYHQFLIDHRDFCNHRVYFKHQSIHATPPGMLTDVSPQAEQSGSVHVLQSPDFWPVKWGKPEFRNLKIPLHMDVWWFTPVRAEKDKTVRTLLENSRHRLSGVHLPDKDCSISFGCSQPTKNFIRSTSRTSIIQQAALVDNKNTSESLVFNPLTVRFLTTSVASVVDEQIGPFCVPFPAQHFDATVQTCSPFTLIRAAVLLSLLRRMSALPSRHGAVQPVPRQH